MKKVLFFLILLLSVKFTFAQIPIGLKFDLNGEPLNGYFDPLLYSPKRIISNVHNSDSYEIGYYYNNSGQKVEGLIRFENDKIFFKKKEEDFRIKINPEEINHFTIGVDSFFSVSNFYFKNRIKEKPEFVQYISEFNGYTFVKHYHFTSIIAQQTGQPPIIETFLVKEKDSLVWVNFPDNNNFKGRVIEYFNHIPYLNKKILSGDYKSEDMLSIIKMAEYYSKYNNSELILYDKYWQETRDINKSEYTALITNKVDSIWTFEYYNDTTKLYQGNYSSFYPNTKNGEFISYYPNGEIRQITYFLNNKPQEVKTFNKFGLLSTYYQIIENKNKSSTKKNADYKYITVNDSLGNNILKSNDISELNVYDKFNNTTYTTIFDKNEIKSRYRLIGTDTIFTISNSRYNLKIKSLQKEFDFFMEPRKYDEALSHNAQGIILISLVIDKRGYVKQSVILNGIHPEIDKLVTSFVKSTLSSEGFYQHRFKPFKSNKTKQFCEFVIPIEFSINRFYKQPVNYNYFNHFNQMQMQQQMIRNHTPTRIPSGF